MKLSKATEIISGQFGSFLLPKYQDYSKLLIKSDGSNWVLNTIANEMQLVCNRIDIPTLDSKYARFIKNQCIYFTSKYSVLSNWKNPKNRIGFPYYHGNPSTHKIFKKMIDNLGKHHYEISRVQVSHSEVEEIILNTGIDSDKVFRIPISIDINMFSQVDTLKRNFSRNNLNISESSLLIGSFQKDGNGWGKGNEPKLIKGPDIFLETIRILKNKFSNIEVLLTGPARGYVKKGLEKINVPYHHFVLSDYSEIAKYYHALDLYLITSREEGGPRAVLESMASGIPLVTTRVGQAMDLVVHGKNGWMVEVEDAEGLAHWSKYVFENTDSIDDVISAARETVEDNCYTAQIHLWRDFMDGFVNY